MDMVWTIAGFVLTGAVAFGAGYFAGGTRGYADGYKDCKRINDPANYSVTRHHADGRRETTYGDGSKATFTPSP